MKAIKPYKKYKPTGIAWLGDIPEHWRLIKLRYLCKITTGNKNTEDKVQDGLYNFYVRSQKIEKINSYTFDGEGILTAGDGVGVGKVFHYINGKCDYHQRVYLFYDFTSDIDAKYLFNFLRSYLKNELAIYNAKSTVDSVRLPVLKDFYVSTSDKSEQTAIVNFLDYKTAKIDRFIFKKKQLIKLLNEQKAGIINAAVTKGIDVKVPLKPSGIEWLGDIPKHWEVRKLKYVAKICNGSDCNKQPIGKYPVYGSGGIFGWNDSFIYDKPSVLLGRKGTIDKPILVYEPFWTVDTAFYTKIKTEIVDVLFFYYLCSNIPFGFYSSKTALPSMTQTSLYEVKFTIPPLTEQKQIVQHIEKETATINKTIATIEKEIALVQEYRTALIAEAVTGKIDVRDYVIPTTANTTYEDTEEELSMVAEDEVEYNEEINE